MSPPVTHFLHIGKTGGTALRTALAPLGGERLVFHEHEFGLPLVPPSDRAIFSVRDPVSRFVSGFNSRLRKGRPRIHAEWSDGERKAFSVFATPNALAQSLFADDPEEAEAAAQAMHAIGHVRTGLSDWLVSCDYLALRRASIAYVVHQSQLDEDFEQIKRLLDLPEAELPSDPINRHENPGELDSTLSERAESNLRRWYQGEFPLYRHCLHLRQEIKDALA